MREQIRPRAESERRNAALREEGTRTIKLFGREIRMPRSRAARVAIGAVLVFFGMLGFLPVLGFWMIPLGMLVLSYEFASVRRMRRRLVVWWRRRRTPAR